MRGDIQSVIILVLRQNMTLFFNLKNLETVSNGETLKLIQTLESYYSKKVIPTNRWQPRFNHALLKGSSFIINPDGLFKDRITDPSYVAQYIRLAGKRSYTLYKFYGAKYLDLSFYPDLDIQTIKHNPLLNIANNQINFKYEEI